MTRAKKRKGGRTSAKSFRKKSRIDGLIGIINHRTTQLNSLQRVLVESAQKKAQEDAETSQAIEYAHIFKSLLDDAKFNDFFEENYLLKTEEGQLPELVSKSDATEATSVEVKGPEDPALMVPTE